MMVKSKYSFGGLEKEKVYEVIESENGLYLVDLGERVLIRAKICFFEEVKTT